MRTYLVSYSVSLSKAHTSEFNGNYVCIQYTYTYIFGICHSVYMGLSSNLMRVIPAPHVCMDKILKTRSSYIQILCM